MIHNNMPYLGQGWTHGEIYGLSLIGDDWRLPLIVAIVGAIAFFTGALLGIWDMKYDGCGKLVKAR